jgi:hypothetical protein
MEQKLDTIWIADTHISHQARFIRQKLFPILLSSQAKGLINMIGASLWISETEGTDSAPKQGERIPEKYTDVALFHIRMDHLIYKKDILGKQGIQDGDVLVLVSSDSGHVNRQLATIRETADFPVSIPGDVPDEVTSMSAAELSKIIRKH